MSAAERKYQVFFNAYFWQHSSAKCLGHSVQDAIRTAWSEIVDAVSAAVASFYMFFFKIQVPSLLRLWMPFIENHTASKHFPFKAVSILVGRSPFDA